MSYYQYIDSPLGTLTLLFNDNEVLELNLRKLKKKDLKECVSYENKVSRKTKIQLSEYFQGKRHSFKLPLANKGSKFQKLVWRELSKIPYGETISYGEQAQRINKPQAQRAVGSANGKNPFPIIIPCHRVLAKAGGLGGFSSGLSHKLKLLEIEGVVV
jgi:methylated-DNA-[protein]-cysteine S-methyltransferase